MARLLGKQWVRDMLLGLGLLCATLALMLYPQESMQAARDGLTLCGNVIMLMIAGALFGWEKALYSMLFQYTTTQVIRMLDPDGRRATLLIITGRETAGGVCAQIQETNHTATLIEGVGLYNGDPCVMIYSVVSDSEVRNLARNIRQSDPKAFVNVLRTERVVGKFYRRPRD